MLYAAQAALSERGELAKAHSGTWTLFSQVFVAPGDFDQSLSALARRAKDAREHRLPCLVAPLRRIAVRSGSKAKKTRIVWVIRSSFMLGCREPSTVSASGRPALGPSSCEASTEATTLRCSWSVRTAHHSSNSSVLSAAQLAAKL